MSEQVWTTIIVGIFGVITSLISAVVLYITRQTKAQAEQTHTLINSRMDELLRQARLLARAEGVAQGEQSQRDRSAEAQP